MTTRSDVAAPDEEDAPGPEGAAAEGPVTAELPATPGSPDDPTDPPKGPTGGHRGRVWLVVVLVIALCAATGVGTWLATRSSGAAPRISVTTETVSATTGNIAQSVSATGTIEPASQSNLNFAVSGQVTAVDVATGATVTAGQTLATIDPTALQSDLSEAQQNLAAAQDRLSQDESDSASSAQIDSDEASVTSAQSSVNDAQENLNDATLTSPIAGTVASVDLTVGQQVSGSGNSNASGSGGSTSTGSTGSSSFAGSSGSGGFSGTGSTGSSGSSGSSGSTGSSSAQVVIVSTGSYVINATVDDTEIGQIQTGDQVTITPSESTTAVYGTVSNYGLIASESDGVATFPVTVAVTGDPSGLYAGATADLGIIVKELYDVVEVPTAAVSYSSSSATVTEVVNGSHVTKDVTVGTSSDGETQITSGLSAGDKVVEHVVSFSGLGGSGSSGSRSFTGTGGFGGFGGAGGAEGGFGGFGGAGGGFGGFSGAGGGAGTAAFSGGAGG